MSNLSQANKKTILIVDDTPENIDILKEILSPLYRIQVATNGRLGLKVAMSPRPPDLILLDVMMPVMDGYETCRLLKESESTRHIPVLFVTAKSEVADETKGFELGAADYLIKPVSPPIVLARVKTHLAMNDQYKHLADQVETRTAELTIRNMALEETRLEMIHQLGRAAEFRDNETGMHILRMSHFTRLLALKAGLSEPEADLLLHAAPMHDIGKIGIPDEILLKPARLTDEEFDVIRTHPEIGHKIIGPQSADILRLGGVIAYTHHEKWNGRGYPRGLQGEEIPLAGRITAVGDVFDALTSARPYKKGWAVEDALALINRETGEHFDPTLAPLFLSLRSEIAEIMDRYQEQPE
ncbi:MAG: response regulator [Magnetococcales bacterium]|nr:response regulator [Magnetococcales bacterium]